jgi:collagenase-like PrtC family protease
MKIIAPVCSLKETEMVFKTGASGVYFGLLTDKWVNKFGEADVMSRRQGKPAHVNSLDEIREIAYLANSLNCDASLVLNSKYTQVQIKYIIDILEFWETNGGKSVIISDIDLILFLKQNNSKLKLYLSTLACSFNSQTVGFFHELGVKKVVLPTYLKFKEIKQLIRLVPSVEYEIIVISQRCQYIDGYCGFYHNVRIPEKLPASFDYYEQNGGYVAYSTDPEYEGHGCNLKWKTQKGYVKNLNNNGFDSPLCATCYLGKLYSSGVGSFKIAGRGYPIEYIIKSIEFIKESFLIHKENGDLSKIKFLYSQAFGKECLPIKCCYES